MSRAAVALFVVIASLASCSTMVASRVVVDCRSGNCDEARVLCMVDVFADEVPGFDPNEELHIVLHEEGQMLDRGRRLSPAAAFTESPHRIQMSGIGYLAHELVHVQLWRVFGDGDATHAEPPGPWRDAHEATAQRIRTAMLNRCPP
jgi:hypothetical protein